MLTCGMCEEPPTSFCLSHMWTALGELILTQKFSLKQQVTLSGK